VLGSRFLSFALVAAVGVVPLAPPEHVHERLDQDHHDVLVHRHAEPHGAHHRSAGSHHDGIFDDDDAPVLILSTTYTVPPAAMGAIGAPPSVFRVLTPPAVQTLHGPRAFVEHLIHGPPRAPAALRAPPSHPTV
jgi:hypothetical protein